MSRRTGVGVSVLVALGLFFAWRAWSGGEEAAVRARLAALVSEVNAPAQEGLGGMARAASIGAYFTDDVQIEMGRGTSPIEGRPMLIGMAARLQPRLSSYKLEIDDVGVTLSNGDTAADVRLTARFTSRAGTEGQASVDARELALGMVRIEGTWRIARLSVVEALR